MNKHTAHDTENWYDRYYAEKGQYRNDPLKNPETLFQLFAFQKALIDGLRAIPQLNPESATVLDVGCGNGDGLLNLMQLGFRSENLFGIDVISNRIERAREQLPRCQFSCGDASSMPYDSESFDITKESTMFVQISDELLATGIAREMLRVTKRGGHILLIDWRHGKPWNSNYKAVTRRRIRQLFSIGSEATVIGHMRGPLIPPIGRKLSAYLPSMYFLVRSLLPVLVGGRATLIRKLS